MNNILQLIKDNEGVKALLENKEGLASLTMIEEALLLMSYFKNSDRNIVVVKNNAYNAQRLYEYLHNIEDDEQILLFNVEESLRIEAIAASPETMVARIETIQKLISNQRYLLITNTAGLIKHLPSKQYFEKSVLSLMIDQEITIDDLSGNLIKSGYQMVSRVDQPLTFARRGGIIDVFSINYNDPIRIEFFDTVIDNIRFFDISTQRTIKLVDMVRIMPATDILFSDAQIKEIDTKIKVLLDKEKTHLTNEDYLILTENINKDRQYIQNHIKDNYLYRYYAYLDQTSSIIDYIDNPYILLSSQEEVKHNNQMIIEENASYIQELYSEHKALLKFRFYHDINDVLSNHDVYHIHQFSSLNEQVSSKIYTLNVPNNTLDVIIKMINQDLVDKRVVICVNEKQIKDIVEQLILNDVSYQMIDDQQKIPSGLSLMNHPLHEGFELAKENVIVYSSKEIFSKQTKIGRYASKFKEAEVLGSYLDLSIGDYVVHNLYGIGKYLGIVTKEVNSNHKDFLNIAYRGDDILLVPLEQFQLVRKFVSKEGVMPRLNKLGTQEWTKIKASVKESVNDIAERLVELYTLREKKIGHAYQPDNEMQIAFEAEFPYELTKDQQQAVIDIKNDMMSEKPMDRLVCGDVGFGKTEVAIRAAFKAVLEHKQVAFLCPTTILAHQHYETFMERFKNYPVKIGLLNRFVLESKQKEVINDVKMHSLDILIGTHRILSKDVKFVDLGLLIIDEEQRFGVEHKEKIKEIKQTIDVLSLSATPIPRTLQMSLIGIRSLSQLNTPPSNRLPVLTYVIERNRNIIKEIIQRELMRNGQVFYLFNNVKQIYSLAAKLRIDLPEAQIAIAHGQMSRQEIEEVMYRFVNNEYNVLICTTIIETGIDIPNANTMIIDNADHFGLSQLYQIKGRVGRSDRLAYAYLMYAPTKQLSEIAQKRLQSIKEFTELGSGYKIAMRDLTIRGAGDLLGPQQSGFIDTVGIDMYIEMLQEAINEKKGIIVEKVEEQLRTPINIDAYIPPKFTADYDKLTLYQRIDKSKSLKELMKLEEEVIDLYGKLPTPVQLLFEKKRLEILIKEPRIKRFKELKQGAEIVFSEEWSKHVNGIKLFEEIGKISSDIDLRYLKGSIIIKFNNQKEWLSQVLMVLRKDYQ
ncbi:MAG: transcription-repair coupling factor [Erysipelotrichaceae bacterium]|nr:transcription-repair coupling factor [Erysipelotrichaceae bacterium]